MDEDEEPAGRRRVRGRKALEKLRCAAGARATRRVLGTSLRARVNARAMLRAARIEDILSTYLGSGAIRFLGVFQTAKIPKNNSKKKKARKKKPGKKEENQRGRGRAASINYQAGKKHQPSAKRGSYTYKFFRLVEQRALKINTHRRSPELAEN